MIVIMFLIIQFMPEHAARMNSYELLNSRTIYILKRGPALAEIIILFRPDRF